MQIPFLQCHDGKVKNMQLITPSPNYKHSFLDALEEYKAEGYKTFIDYDIRWVVENFEAFVAKLLQRSQGIGLSAGCVPDTQLWLIDGEEYIGNVGIRHQLTEALLREGGHIGYDIRPSKRRQGYGTKILALALPKAKALGIAKVLVTCDETNIGSKKIIEANGGVLENSVSMRECKPNKLRYWIA